MSLLKSVPELWLPPSVGISPSAVSVQHTNQTLDSRWARASFSFFRHIRKKRKTHFFFCKLRLQSERASARRALVPGLNWALCLYRCKFRVGNCSRQRTQQIVRGKWEKELITPQRVSSSFIGKTGDDAWRAPKQDAEVLCIKHSALWLWLSCYTSSRMIWFDEM